MSKPPSLGVRLQPETKAALQKAAKADMRSVSSLVEKVLVQWLTAQGFLKAPKGEVGYIVDWSSLSSTTPPTPSNPSKRKPS